MKHIFDVKNVPKGPHIAVLLIVTESKQEWVEDYSPPPRGHSGYQQVERTTVEYWVADSEKDLCDWLRATQKEGVKRKDYAILNVTGQMLAEFSVSLSLKKGTA